MPTGKSFNVWKWYVDSKLFKNSKYCHDNTYNVMEGHCYSIVTSFWQLFALRTYVAIVVDDARAVH